MAQTRRWPFCGCLIPKENLYLPLLKPEAYTNIFTTSSRTVLKQTFINPQDRPLNEVRYFFPIYDGVSVVSFKCVIGARVIQGVVKEREEARSEYKAAIDSGSTAALLEMSPDASDVFTTSLGNVPANETIEVEITYLAELKHDAETDGIRLTIPTSIAPRYGHASHESWPRLLPDSKGKYYTPTTEEGITFTVDIQMFKDSVIRSVQSPSHPISVSIGTTSTDPSAEPCMQKASASLSLGSTALDKDFVVQITATNLGNPWALLETHPTLPNQRALTATLVPKFALPAETPEVVFICDRSGSMGVGNNIPNLISALQIFLRSLPIGAKFNICSFGSRHEFLWSKSKSYTQESLQEATKYVAKVQADFGGTEMYEPLRETFSRRYKDINLEVFLLTDGEVWQQDRLFELINNEVAVSKGAIRVFTLGVGNGVSHALIEGAARAGNGFSQTVGENEKMTSKVVRMLKAALSPHITDYTLEIKYDTNSDSDDEFMLVEKINDSLNITVTEIPESPQSDSPPKSKLRKLATKPLSLFNPDLKEEPIEVPKEFPAHSSSKRFSRLPHVETPRYIQAPHEIPPMFPFSRSTVYVLLSDSAPDRQPTSVVLRATSAHGPLELEVPVTTLPEKGLTIHQLAARKTIHELEGRRGWIFHAKDKKGRLLKEAHESCFSDMVEREAVRLGVKYQTAGKWCSFVAVDSSKTESDAKKSGDMAVVNSHMLRSSMWDKVDDATISVQHYRTASVRRKSTKLFNRALPQGFNAVPPPPPAPAPAAATAFLSLDGARQSFGGTASPALYSAPLSRTVPASYVPGEPVPFSGGPRSGLTSALLSRRSKTTTEEEEEEEEEDGEEATTDPKDTTTSLAMLQTFEGNWTWSPTLEKILGVNKAEAETHVSSEAYGGEADVLATLCVMVYMKTRLADDKDSWEMLVEKAETWVANKAGKTVGELENVVKTALQSKLR